jgi:hypothetical protein
MKSEMNPELDIAKDVVKGIRSFFRSIGSWVEKTIRRHSLKRRILSAGKTLVMDVEREDIAFVIILATRNRDPKEFLVKPSKQTGLKTISMKFEEK